MNRMGTDDYVRQIHPEDDMDVMGEYLMWRFYPKWTQMRIAMGLPYPVPPEQRAILDAAVLRQMTPEEVAMSQQAQRKEWRGPSTTIGLWMFQTDAREPLKYVMMRYVLTHQPMSGCRSKLDIDYSRISRMASHIRRSSTTALAACHPPTRTYEQLVVLP